MVFGSRKKRASRDQAFALDAADGVIDGRYYGAPVVPGRRGAGPSLAGPGYYGAGYPATYGAPAFGAPAYGAPAFGAPAFGAPAFGASYYGAPAYGATSSALALDAADGVIDGRHFGRPIVGAGAPAFAPTYPAMARSFPTSSALSLDAADGVIDGRYFGRPIVGGAPALTTFAPTITPSFAPTSFGVPAFGASSSALALDAADGVIDGRHFGRPIVQSAPQFAPTFPAGFPTAYPTTVGAFPTAYPTTFGASSSALALDAADGVIDGRHFGRPIVQSGFPQASFPTTFASGYHTGFPTSFAPSSNALALDAADGVIDGRHFGRPIVQQPAFGGFGGFGTTFGATTFGAPATSAAFAADAADGVIDGKYFGRPIVQA